MQEELTLELNFFNLADSTIEYYELPFKKKK